MTVTSQTKADLRRRLRAERIAHAAALPTQVRALIFHRPPRPVLDLVPAGATVGLYHATPGEAPTGGYARFFLDQGHPIALPWFAAREAAMTFRLHSDPFEGSDLFPGPFGVQPDNEAEEVQPDVLFVPVVGFTGDGQRLGQGGGHYDRWLAAHPGAIPVGMAWDMQEIPQFAAERHDVPLRAVVTPTRVLGPFA
ncbi:5-formyltetrahydrofolate cyclo-ligase [Tsuneonella sp. HG094]